MTRRSASAAARKAGINRDTVYAWREADAAFAAELQRGGDAYEAQTDLIETAVYKRALKGSAREALAWLRARRPEVWDRPRAISDVQVTQHVSQSFQTLDVRQLSDEALAEYKAMLEKMVELAKREPHAIPAAKG